MTSFFNDLTDICHELLKKNKALLGYLNDRNISNKTIAKYKIGAFPADLRLLLSRMPPQELVSRGILWNASESPFRYSVRGQTVSYPVVIPVSDTAGEVIAIGCRTLMTDDERREVGVPKYKNSEYKKTAYLYGLNHAIDHILNKDQVFVVEGYFDVISCHQSGIHNVVGTCGTLFSKRQLAILSRYTSNIVLLFDNDKPGKTSAKRVMDKFSNHNLLDVSIKSHFTPEKYKDIDEYLCSGGNLDFFAI